MRSDRVNQIIENLLEIEGGYSDRKEDRGGKTNYGITEAVARAYGYVGDMKDLPRELAKSIYLDRYWVNPGFAQVWKVSEKLAEELFDTGVNMGVGTASAFLQRALNALNRQSKLYADTKVDGQLGRMTFAALTDYLEARKQQDGERVLITLLDSMQAVKYLALAEADVSQEENLFGWLRSRTR